MAEEKNTLGQVVAALLKWKGNLQAAADELGVTRQSIYGRLQRAELKPGSFRQAGNVHVFPDAVSTPSTPSTDMSTSTRKEPTTRVPVSEKPASVYSRAERPPPSFGSMEAAAEPAIPFKLERAPTKRPPARNEPDYQERLRRARLEIIRVYGVELAEQTIHNQFVAEAFEDWFGGKLKRPEGGAGSSKK